MIKSPFLLGVTFCVLFLMGCRSATIEVAERSSPMEVAYRHLLENWQPMDLGSARRGYNIAAVLVSPDGQVLGKELNCVIALQDCTQHAEMRLIQKYLTKHKCFNLNGYTVYTTLEPCAMCASTMAMTGIKHVYYGQSDPEFGKAAERLFPDTSGQGGYKPYPRSVQCELLCSPLQNALEKGFQQSGIREITKWLASNQANRIIREYLSSAEECSVDGRNIP